MIIIIRMITLWFLQSGVKREREKRLSGFTKLFMKRARKRDEKKERIGK